MLREIERERARDRERRRERAKANTIKGNSINFECKHAHNCNLSPFQIQSLQDVLQQKKNDSNNKLKPTTWSHTTQIVCMWVSVCTTFGTKKKIVKER